MESGQEELYLFHAPLGIQQEPGAGWWIDIDGCWELLADGNVAREVIVRRFREEGWELSHQAASPEGISSLCFHRKQAQGPDRSGDCWPR